MNNTILRSLLKIGGGYFVARGLASASETETIISALVSIIGIIMGIVAKLPSTNASPGASAPKTLLLALIGAVSLFGFTGCISQSVPRLKFSVNPQTGEVKFENPKDMNVSNFVASVSTNGTRQISWSSLSSGMNPDVITTTGAAQAAMISGVANAVGNAVSAAAKTAVVAP